MIACSVTAMTPDTSSPRARTEPADGEARQAARSCWRPAARTASSALLPDPPRPPN